MNIGPMGAESGQPLERVLVGLAIGLIPVLVVAVRFVTVEHRAGATDAAPYAGRVAAKAVVIGMVAFVTGLASTAVVLPVGARILRAMASASFQCRQ